MRPNESGKELSLRKANAGQVGGVGGFGGGKGGWLHAQQLASIPIRRDSYFGIYATRWPAAKHGQAQ